jgi:hypothetical protein
MFKKPERVGLTRVEPRTFGSSTTASTMLINRQLYWTAIFETPVNNIRTL